MSNSISSQIEDSFNQLTVPEQLSLLERLARRVGAPPLNERYAFERELSVMATDPEVQSELRKIEQEFSYAEADGLETA